MHARARVSVARVLRHCVYSRRSTSLSLSLTLSHSLSHSLTLSLSHSLSHSLTPTTLSLPPLSHSHHSVFTPPDQPWPHTPVYRVLWCRVLCTFGEGATLPCHGFATEHPFHQESNQSITLSLGSASDLLPLPSWLSPRYSRHNA